MELFNIETTDGNTSRPSAAHLLPPSYFTSPRGNGRVWLTP